LYAGIPLAVVGLGLSVPGIVLWAVGQNRMNRINADGFSLFENEKIQLNLSVGGNNVGLKLNF